MASDDKAVKFNMDNLNELIASMKTEYVLRVGILGSKAKAQHDGKGSKSGLTNAELGSFHEFGTKNLPRRSFLEDSLKLKLKFNDEQFREMRKSLFIVLKTSLSRCSLNLSDNGCHAPNPFVSKPSSIISKHLPPNSVRNACIFFF